MIRRFYVHNFRCLENFELPLSGQSSVLLIGKNGAGKTTVALALEILQKIARGTNRVEDLVSPEDFTCGRTDVPIRFEIEVDLGGKTYVYWIAFELPHGSRELRVAEERLAVDRVSVYYRSSPSARSPLITVGSEDSADLLVTWHLVALPIVQEKSVTDPLFVFKRWLARTLILRPIPALIDGESKQETLEPNSHVTDFGAWFSGLLASSPAAYANIAEYLKQVMPDLDEIRNPLIGKDSRSLMVRFSNDAGNMSVSFADLSDGEKCFMICALVLAANIAYGPLVCFWDEPDNYLALDEVGHFVLGLRKALGNGQFIATSHNPEAIRRFSDENTLLLYRKSHLEPTILRRLNELHVNGDLVNALVRGDVEP